MLIVVLLILAHPLEASDVIDFEKFLRLQILKGKKNTSTFRMPGHVTAFQHGAFHTTHFAYSWGDHNQISHVGQ